MSAEAAADVLRDEVSKGRFDAESVRAVLSGEADGREAGAADRARPARASLLSPREAEVLRHISLGASNKEVARVLQMSPSTVRTHVESVFRKLDCSTRAAATLKASTLGLI